MPFDVEAVQLQRPQNPIHYFPSIGSTMVEGGRLAQEGALHGTVVLADEQVAGVGRLGRHWHSESEAGLYTSTLLRLPLAPADLPVASLLLGLAVARAIQHATQLRCDLRWPNDVLMRERKVAGILPQLVAGSIVAGIGVNVNQQTFAPDLRTPATSLSLETGVTQSREHLLVCLLEALDSTCATLIEEGVPAILRAFAHASSYVNQRRVVIEETGVLGTTKGLDEHGFLLLQTDRGVTERVASGGVRPA